MTKDTQELALQYIARYNNLAVSEMERTGIPASIKLAQGLLESDWGRSDLANVAHNHFGIKCGGNWVGKTFMKIDDDKDEDGNLTHSCFRAYDTDIESYMAHSDFLMDPNKKYRYGFLFKFGSTDYKSWAFGLKKAGYATDPKYPYKLISIIEKFKLYRFDKPVHLSSQKIQKAYSDIYNYPANAKKEDVDGISMKPAGKSNHVDHPLENPSRIKDFPSKNKMSRNPDAAKYRYTTHKVNHLRMVIAHGGETIYDISKKVRIEINKLLKYNEIYIRPDQVLQAGDIVYLQKKKRTYEGLTDFHIVIEGETIGAIAQKYGLRTYSLRAKNRIPRDGEVIPGTHLSLKKTVSIKNRPPYKIKDADHANQFLF